MNPVDHRWADKQASAIIDSHTPYEHDPRAQAFVSAYPDGATLDMVGAMFGVTRERARQIEADALRKLAPFIDANPALAEIFELDGGDE